MVTEHKTLFKFSNFISVGLYFILWSNLFYSSIEQIIPLLWNDWEGKHRSL